jgi:hypothetical protein
MTPHTPVAAIDGKPMRMTGLGRPESVSGWLSPAASDGAGRRVIAHLRTLAGVAQSVHSYTAGNWAGAVSSVARRTAGSHVFKHL